MITVLALNLVGDALQDRLDRAEPLIGSSRSSRSKRSNRF